MRRFKGRLFECENDNPGGDLVSERIDPRGPCFVAQEGVETFFHEPLLPTPDTGLGLTGQAHDLIRPDALGAEQHDSSPPDVLLCDVAILDERPETAVVDRRNSNGNSSAHSSDSHNASQPGIPIRTQMSDLIH